MKKFLIILTIALSLVGINRVSADTFELVHSDTAEISCDFHVTDYDYLKELGYEEVVQELYNLIIKKYNEEYSSVYPYFFISLSAVSDKNCNFISSFDKVDEISMSLLMYSEIPITNSYQFPYTTASIVSSYDVSTTTYNLPIAYVDAGFATISHPLWPADNLYLPLRYFVSNFDFTVNGENSFNITGNSNFIINPGDTLKPIYTYGNAFQTNHVEINLNDYAYVALALKDYNREAFSTNVQVKGQYCLTPVYNYGLTERKEILDGSKVDRCSPYYDNYTSVRTSILTSDLQNYAIYYLKAYDTSKDNYVKIDTTVFDVTLITEEEKDNPYVTVNGKTYPTIPYDELTDTATKSEDEGYVPGASEEFNFSDIFTAPLEFLEDIWGSIVSVFDLVKEFFSLLPEPIPTFLITSFVLGLSIGLLKLIF